MRKKLPELQQIALSYNIATAGKRKQQLCDEILKTERLVLKAQASPRRSPSPKRSRSLSPKRSPLRGRNVSPECEEWLASPGINPRTGKAIKIGGPTYKKLEKECTPTGSPSPRRRSPSPRRRSPSPRRRSPSPPRKVVVRTKGALNKMKKGELVTLAIDMGLDPDKLLKPGLVDLIFKNAPVASPVRPKSPSPVRAKSPRPKSPSPKRSPSPRMSVKLTKADLKKMKKPQLVQMAKTLGIETKGLLKAQLEVEIFQYVPRIPSAPRTPPRRSSSRKRSPTRRSPVRSVRSRSVRNISNIGDLQDLIASEPHLDINISARRSLSVGDDLLVEEVERKSSKRVSPPRSPRRSSPRRSSPRRSSPRRSSPSFKHLIPEDRREQLKQLDVAAKRDNFRLINVPLDGNCMFSVIGRAFDRSASVIRKITIDYLIRCKESFGVITGIDNFDGYINEMRKGGCWGDEIALSAASLALNFQYRVLNTNGDWITSNVTDNNIGRVVHMGYLDNFHYLSLEPMYDKFDTLTIPTTQRVCPALHLDQRSDLGVPERIQREADVVDQEILTSVFPPFEPSKVRSLRPSIPQPSVHSVRPEKIPRSVPRLRPSVPRPSSRQLLPTPGNLPLARLETLTKIKDIIDALQRPIEHKLSTLTNTEKAIMQCIGVA
jgi:hypothetical protein